MKWLVLLLTVVACAAQPARMKVQWEYPSNELVGMYFWVERKTNANSDWVTFSVLDPSSGTNHMAFYNVGVDWRTNAPSWMTNFQFVELPPVPAKAKLLTAGSTGSKTGKLPSPVKLPPKPKTFRAVPPPTPAK